MTNIIDAGMLELLASKICHDLISPIGAVNNGIELITDLGQEAGPEAMELISFSANQASAKLQAFRLAYGAGGADGNIKPEDVHKSIQLIIGVEKKLTQDWNPHGALGEPSARPGFCKILTCVLLLAMRSLPRGGKLYVTGDGSKTLVKAEGVNAGLRPLMEKALKLEIASQDMEPTVVHACLTGLMAKNYGFNVALGKTGEGFIEFNITASA